MQLANIIKNDRYYQVIGVGRHSETLENMFFVKPYALPLICLKWKFGTDRPKLGKKIRKEIKGRNPRF